MATASSGADAARAAAVAEIEEALSGTRPVNTPLVEAYLACPDARTASGWLAAAVAAHRRAADSRPLHLPSALLPPPPC